MTHKGLRCWELDFVLIAVTQVFVHHKCFKDCWSAMAEKGALWAILKRPTLEREGVGEGGFFGSMAKGPCQRGLLEKPLLALSSPDICFSSHPNGCRKIIVL